MEEDKKVLVFDNEWVIVRNDWNNVARLVSEGLGTPLLSGKELKQSFRLYDKGPDNPLYRHNRGLLTVDEFWPMVIESYGKEPTAENVAIMRHAMQALTTDTDPPTVELIRQLRGEGHRLFMLSNSTPDIYQGNRERHDYFGLFEDCCFSFQTGFRKPEAGAYLALVKRNSLVPGNCIFIDDKEENLEGARAPEVGMQALYHKMGDGDLLEHKLRPLL
jgi:HAD superfamily hydrolase (TIGR01509 family)